MKFARESAPKRKPERVPTSVKRLLRLLRKRMEFRQEDFGCGKTPAEKKLIIERTKLWRETWVLPQLNSLIEWTERERDARSLRRHL